MESNYTTWTAAAMLLTTSWIYFRLVVRPKLEAKKPIPGVPMPPNSHWLVGHLALVLKTFKQIRPGDVYQHRNEHGQVGLWLLGTPTLVLFHVEDAKTVLTNEYMMRYNPLFKHHSKKNFGNKPFAALMGREWKQHRDAVHKSVNPVALKEMRAGMIEVAETLVTSLKRYIQEQAPTTGFIVNEVEDMTKMITMDAFSRSAFSRDLGCCEKLQKADIVATMESLIADVKRRVEGAYNPFNWFYGIPTKLNRENAANRAKVADFIQEMVVKRQNDIQSGKSTPNDMLHHLMSLAEEDHLQGDLKSGAIYSIVMSLILAGHETTSVTLIYVLYLIAAHPKVEQNCLHEISAVMANNGGVLDPEKLVYCNAVIREAQRLYQPNATISRVLQKPMKLQGGLVVPAGTYVVVNAEQIHRNERHFPNPDDFDPERWVAPTKKSGSWIEQVKEGNEPDAFLAFGMGARRCPGQRFAAQEAVLVIATLIRELKFELTEGYVLNPVREGLIQHPDDGLPLKISVREK